ncbi:MAG: scyllo-inosose 3-dehydrogenase [Verrucomicrobiota bacterium]|nr:scyllo-inosose 3-dehydrogenase [Verrucomicrobiota bacterium]
MITVTGGVNPGDIAIVCGGGAIGLAACAILKRAGSSLVILSEPSNERAQIGLKLGADVVIDPNHESFTEKILELTGGRGGNIYLEASGLQATVWPQIETCIWKGKTIGAKVCIVSRSDEKLSVSAEVLQVKRASIIGAYGHAGHNNFYNAIQCVAGGMNVLPLITKTVLLEEVPAYLLSMQKDKTNCKVSVVMK